MLVLFREPNPKTRDAASDARDLGEFGAHFVTAAAIRVVVGHGGTSLGCEQWPAFGVFSRGWGRRKRTRA